jgi:hypothetical protein
VRENKESIMDLRTIIAQLGQLEENRKVAGKAYGGAAQKDDDKEDKSSKELDTSGGADIQDMIGKKPATEVGKTSVTHKLKEYMEQIESSKKQLDEVALDQSQVAVPSVGAAAQPSATSRPAGNAAVGMQVLDFKKPNDPLKAALAQAVQNKEVTALGEENLEEVAPPGMEDVVLSLKKKYPNQEGRAYAIAWDMYNKKHKKDESMYESAEADKQPIMESMLEEILEAYPHEHKMCQEGWSMDEGLYEALCDHYYKEGRIPRKIWHGPLEELRKHVESCYMEDTGCMTEEKKEYDIPPSMRKPATLDKIGVQRTVDLVPQQQANRELNKELEMEPSMRKTPFETMQRPMTFESDSKERPYVCVHAKKGKHECKASSSYEAAKKAAAHWGMKNTAGIDAHLADIEHKAVNESDDMGPVTNKEKTVTVTHKTSGKELVIKDTPENRKKYKEMGYEVQSLKEDHMYKPVKKVGNVEIHQGFIDGQPADYVVKVGGEVKAKGMYDFPSNSFWFKIQGVKGDKAFDELDDVVNFFNKGDRLDEKYNKLEESWQSQLNSLLNEGLTVTTSTGGPMGQEDSVSVSASGEDAKSMMELLRNAGIGHGAAEASHDMNPEVTDQDEVLGQLGGQEHDDSGDTDLSFLKKMIGTPVEADCGCDEGQTQTASPGDSHMSPMANKMDEADVEEGNLFTKGLEDDDVKIGEKIPGTDAIKTKDIGESDDLGPVKDTGGKCNMVHKTSGKEIVVRDEPDVIKKYEAMGYKKQVEEADDDDDTETSKSSTGGRIERKDGVTKHHAGKHYGGSEDKDDDDEDIKEDSYDADDPTDVAGEKDERSEAMRDAGLAASYVPEEALDQPATFEGKSCMECGSPMEESSHECNECGYMEAMHEDGMAEITIEKTPHGQLSVIRNGKQIATANYDSDSDSYWVFDPISKSDKAFDSKEEIIAHFSKHSMAESEVEESALQAYLGKKKYGEEGMKALQQAGRDGASKEEMAKIRAKHDKLDEEGYTFEGLFKKLAMIAEESTAEKDDKAEKAGEKVTKDIEYDDKHDYYFGNDKGSSSKVRHTATGHKAEKTDKGTKYTKNHDDKLDEWANSPQNDLSDEEFQTEMNYMLQALSGGLNGPKVDNTTLPKTQVRPVVESEGLDGWLKLAGIK